MEPKNPEFENITNGNDKRGTAIIFKNTLNLKAAHKSPEGRIARTEFDNFVIVNVYAFPYSYNAETYNKFFNVTLPQYFRPSEERLILLGDFNATIDKMDGGHHSTPLKLLIQGMKLVDAYTNRNKGYRTFTFKARGGQSRIDRIYIAKGMTKRLRKCDVIPYAESDHDAVVAEVDFQSTINDGQTTNQYTQLAQPLAIYVAVT
jgi:exonuclease III